MRFLILFVIACSQAPEPTGSQSDPWFNTCDIEVVGSDVEHCSNLVRFTCKDGTLEYLFVPALAMQWIGTPCLTSTDATYYYECGLVDGRAQVYCKNW